MAEQEDRALRILNAAADLMLRHGYDKTTMSDVADEVGISRGIVYLHFESKDQLFEALVYREFLEYTQIWLEHIEANPRGGTVGGIYRAVLYAINSRPLMAAIMRRDRRVFGNYLRKPDNLFVALQSASIGEGLLQSLQAVGAVRDDVDPVVMSHIMDMLSYGLVTIQDFKQPDELPPFDAVMETIANMMDQLLTPANGGNSDAGKAVIRQIAAAAKAQLDQMKQSEK